ncbi:MAG: tetratricopeptide repeat-containing sensor histidine kinase [Flavobacteriales bacterium]|nr:tetratricopeptide repeat-containing sensor histidine kinase [Flavobacteriales bacterium]
MKKRDIIFILVLMSLIFKPVSGLAGQAVVDSLVKESEAARDTNALKALNILAKETLSNPKVAMEYAEKAVKLSKELKDTTRWALSVNQVGLAWYYQGELGKCLEALKMTLQLYTLLKNERGIANSLNGIGVIHYDQGELKEALDHYLRSLEIQEKGNDPYAIAMTVNNIGNVYKDLGNFKKSMSYYNWSLEIKEEIDDKHGLATTLNNIGLLHNNHQKYEQALEYYQKSIMIKEKIDDKHGLAMTINNVGLVYENLQQWNKALENYERSTELKEQIGDKFGMAMTLINIGAVYKNIGAFKKSVANLEKALSIAIDISSNAQKRDVYLRLSETYKVMGKGILALEYHMLYTAIKDKMMNEEGLKRIAEMEAKYQNKKKEQRIVILRKDKQLQEAELRKDRIIIWAFAGGLMLVGLLAFYLFRGYQQKQKVNKQLEDRVELKHLEISELVKRLKQEIEGHKKTQSKLEAINAELNNFMYKSSHDLKGPLASIIGLTNMAQKQSTEKERLEYIGMISKSTHRLNGILDNLLEITKVSHRTLNIEPVHFTKIVAQIVKSLESAAYAKNVKFEIIAEENLKFHSDEKLLITVLQNLIDNSLRYKNKLIKEAYVRVGARKLGNGVEITVSDNGQGIPKDQQSKVFEMFVRANLESEGTGLGLYIVKKAIEKLGGIIALESEVGVGTTFNIYIVDREILAGIEAVKDDYINN